MNGKFRLKSDFKAAGDQPAAIERLCANLRAGAERQALLGVTGSGKTFTMASVIERLQKPALVMSPNKVLAAQLYAELKAFFPENAVEYFISYYDYYQPEAYVPQTDTYIEKDSAINEHIDKLRLRATASLLGRRDTIVVASVSCIYNIGSPDSFSGLCLALKRGERISRTALLRRLTEIRYERNEVEFVHGRFRARGAAVDVFPPYAALALRITLEGETIVSLRELDAVSGEVKGEMEQAFIYPAKHFVATEPETMRGIAAIRDELAQTLPRLEASGKLLEAQRLKQRTEYDLEMLEQTGFCSGIENYSRHLSGRAEGERPFCLLDYYKKDDFLLFMDESHVGVPQIRGMYEGDRSRKKTLVDFGFRLPSALDNRPLKFEEFEKLMPQTVFVSATPGPYELKAVGKDGVVEQIIRPTGLVDPPVSIHPSEGQIKHLMGLIKDRAAKNERSLVLTLTKKTAEDVAAFLAGKGLRVNYLHSEIEALERIKILLSLRKGEFDVLVGINLLREGLDIPEVSLVAILEADNEGFLRSETTLVQISGRAARHLSGEVVLYADRVTGSMQRAMDEMTRRRAKQEEYNRVNKITPVSITKAIQEVEAFQNEARKTSFGALLDAEPEKLTPKTLPGILESVEKQMREAADNLDFELAAALRDRLFELRGMKAQPVSGTQKAVPKRARKNKK